MNFRNLDEATRKHMKDEIDADVASGKLYRSKWFSPAGDAVYEKLLRDAAREGNHDSLANGLRSAGAFKPSYAKKTPSGGITTASVPKTAPEMFSEGEFNRFYMRGVCSRVIAESKPHVEVYRAKEVRDPRPQSQARIGAKLDPKALLDDLRKNIGIDTHLGIPAGPNSGLSVWIPK